MNTYKIDFAKNTITITADFAEKMQNPLSAEYQLIKEIRADFPDMQIVKRTHKTPAKYKNNQGETFNCNQFKNLKYENMERFIKVLPNSEEYLQAYNFLKNCGSLVQTARYTVVRKWFVAQFPEFRKNPLFYLYNDVKVIDIAPFIQEAKEHADEQEAEKAM